MAYIVKRGNVFHLSHCATADGKRTRFSTGLRDDIPGHVRRANELEAEYTLKERTDAVNIPRHRANEKWDKWVYYEREDGKHGGWAAIRYKNDGTLTRWLSIWKTLKIFFEANRIHTPRDLTRQHCFDYFPWRITPERETETQMKARKKLGLHKATRNTALLEMRTLGVIMKEAVFSGYAPANPCRELGLGKAEENKPVELTDKALEELEANIQNAPEPERTILWRSYLIAIKHGVRISETCVNPMRDVLLREPNTSEITFYQKGGRVRTKPLHPDLFQMFKELQGAKATATFPKPINFQAFWWKRINGWGMRETYGKVCFHSLRVTVQNKLRRAGINDEIRRAYLSHERKGDVHSGYSRIGVNELRVCHPVLSSSPLPVGQPVAEPLKEPCPEPSNQGTQASSLPTRDHQS